MGVVAGTLYRSPMVKFLSWAIYFHDFGSYLFDRELFYAKAFFLSGLARGGRLQASRISRTLIDAVHSVE